MRNSIVGIDIGGTKIRSVLLSGSARLSSSARWNGKKVFWAWETNTPKSLSGFREALKQHSDILKNVGVFGKYKIGIAVPGRSRGSVFISATNLPYIKNLNLKTLFKNLNIKSIRIDHDARCFARAEYGSKIATFFLTLGTGVGRAFGKNGKVLKIKKFEYPERWEKEYKKIRDSKNNRALADFLAKNLKARLKKFKPKIIVVSGGVARRLGFLTKLQKALGLPVQKSKFGQNAVAIGAAMLCE